MALSSETIKPCRIELFGPLRVVFSERTLTHFPLKKAAQLLAYLALHSQRPHTREHLIDLLWPEMESPAGRANLSTTLSSLRRELEALGLPSGTLLITSRESIGLQAELFTTDVAEFDALLKQAKNQALATERSPFLEKAIALYKGDLLEGDYEDWALRAQVTYRERYSQALIHWAQSLESQQDGEAVLQAARRAVEVAPLHEAAVRILMEVQARQGQVSAALESYHQYRQRLQEELGAQPTRELHQLQESLQQEPEPTLPAFLSNLPQQLTTFIGREREIREVAALLEKKRLLTLTGSGGTGKTRLSLQVATDSLELFPEGVWFVDLALISSPSLVALTLAQVLGIKEQPDKSLPQILTERLKTKRLLIVLDNCEHLLDACAKLADSLVRACPRVQILASSREALAVPGEQTYRVPPLSLPDMKQPQTPEALVQYEAVQLFMDRAQLTRPDFQVTQGNAAVLASLCCRLDGIPLAIELAVGRLRSLSLEEIAHRLDQRFNLLTGGARTALPRQQTLRALIDWSYDVLSEQERTLLHRLSVFAGGWTLEAAEVVCSDRGERGRERGGAVLDLLTSLWDKSLVLMEPGQEQVHYRLLESVREYAREKLLACGDEAPQTSRRHAEHFLAFAQARLEHRRTAQEPRALVELEKDEANLRAALETAQQCEDTQQWEDRLLWGGLALANGVQKQHRGFLHDAIAAVESGLQALSPADFAGVPLRAQLLQQRAGLHLDFKELVQTVQRAQEANAIYEQLQDRLGQARVENILGQAAMQEADYLKARQHYQAALVKFEAVEDQIGIAIVLNNLGIAERRDHSGTADVWSTRMVAAEKHLTRALQIRRTLNDRRGLAETLNSLGVLAHERSEWEKAGTYYQEALRFYEELRDTMGLGYMLANLGEIAQNQQQYHQAARLYIGSISLFNQVYSPVADDVESLLTQVVSLVDASKVASLRTEVTTLTEGAKLRWALSEEPPVEPQ